MYNIRIKHKYIVESILVMKDITVLNKEVLTRLKVM